MYACMTPVGFDTSDKFENHCVKQSFCRILRKKWSPIKNVLLYAWRPISIGEGNSCNFSDFVALTTGTNYKLVLYRFLMDDA